MHKVKIIFIFSGCNLYSDTFTRTENTYITKFNLAQYFDTNLSECKQKCIDHGQNCASVDYLSSDGGCWLNCVTYQQILDGDPSQLVLANNYDIYTRDCLMD